MTRMSPWPALAVALAAALVGFVGCNARSPSEPGRTVAIPPPRPDEPPTSPATSSKPFAHWPKPAGALIVSGEQDGYLEPCGCTMGQLGGLGRRYDLVQKLKAQGWPLALVDLGSLVKDPAASRGGIDQAKIKFSVALRALAAMGYDALALSAEDLKLTVAEVLGQYLNLGDHPKVVCANVEPSAGFEDAVRKSVRTHAGPIRLGITAALDPEELQGLNDPDKAALLSVRPPHDALPAVLSDLEKDTDVQVLMVQGPPEKARELARAYPGFDLVISTSQFADPAAEPESLNGGKTWLLQVGKKGKYVGVVGLFQDAPRFRYQRVALNEKYENAELMRKLINEEYPSELQQMGIVENFPRRQNVNAPPGATYLGAEACKTCHPNTFARWASTKHAQAFHALEDPKRYRVYDAECVSCHTTGFEYVSGWVSPEATPHLKGQQCENCHGPGSKHAEAPDDPEYRKAMALTAEEAKNSLCIRCHDEDNDPHFDFTKYWGQVVHKGMDRYDDPKVHEGLPPQAAPGAE